MRQIATLSDEQLATRFTDHLLTLSIHTELIEEGEAIGVWVRDEDKVERAKDELRAFLEAPDDPRYDQAASLARSIRQKEAKQESDYQQRQRRFTEIMYHTGLGERPLVTYALIFISIYLTLSTNFGSSTFSRLQQAIMIQSVVPADEKHFFVPTGLTDVAKGQVWRLVTPIFLHFSPMHLIFNCLMAYQLGAVIEISRGRWRFFFLVLLLAVTSNAAQFYVHVSLDESPWLSFTPTVLFGGLSGVLYGLFGYLWMKSKYEPEMGIVLSQQVVWIMLGWLVLCMLGVLGPIANTAHLVGLVVGMAVALVPLLWRR